MPEAVIVGVTGYAQSGKDTVAAYLVERHGFVRRAFADALREHIYDLDPIVGDHSSVRYQWALNEYGYERAKAQFPEIRRLLQRYGTEVWRDRDEDAWIKQHERWLADRPEVGLVVVPDVRFPNEADYVDWLIRVHRPGVGPVNAHVSDNLIETLPVDFEVLNDGTVEELWAQIEPRVPTLRLKAN